jgi:hypothetical protein
MLILGQPLQRFYSKGIWNVRASKVRATKVRSCITILPHRDLKHFGSMLNTVHTSVLQSQKFHNGIWNLKGKPGIKVFALLQKQFFPTGIWNLDVLWHWKLQAWLQRQNFPKGIWNSKNVFGICVKLGVVMGNLPQGDLKLYDTWGKP